MNHNQALYDGIFQKCLDLGYKTFDYLPPTNTKYPFIHLGEVTVIPIPTKNVWLGEATVTINVWGDGKDRKAITNIMDDLIKNLREVKHFKIMPKEIYTRVLKDTTTSNVLWHGILELKYKFI